MGNKEESMLTTDEAAEVLGLKTVTVRRYITSGLLKTIKRGTMHFINRTDLEQFKGDYQPKPRPARRKNADDQ